MYYTFNEWLIRIWNGSLVVCKLHKLMRNFLMYGKQFSFHVLCWIKFDSLKPNNNLASPLTGLNRKSYYNYDYYTAWPYLFPLALWILELSITLVLLIHSANPTVTPGRDHCFRTCPSIRPSPLFRIWQNKIKWKQCPL